MVAWLRLIASSALLIQLGSVALCFSNNKIGFVRTTTVARWNTVASEDSTLEQDSEKQECLRTSPTPLPPVIQHIADERREFQLNLGRAMDVLKRDMPDILRRKPDFSIYHDEIRLVDPSGVQLSGLEKYKSGFAFFQTFVNFWFTSQSIVQYRMVYDFCRSSIRISWNAVLIPKVPLVRPLYVDGISYYQLDSTSGKISEHRIEKLVINGSLAQPPYGVLSLLQQDLLAMRPQGVPVGA